MPSLTPGTSGNIDLTGSQSQQPDPLQFVATLQALKQQKQQGAMQQLTQAMQMVQQGVNIDPKELEKFAKEAGIDPGTGMSSTPPTSGAAPLPGGVTPQSLSSLGKTMEGPNSGYQAANEVSDSAASKAPAGGKTKAAVGGNAGMFQQWHAQATEKFMRTAQTEKDKALVEQSMNRLTLDAIDLESPTHDQSMGLLRRHAGVPFNLDEARMQDPKLGPAVRERMYNEAVGNEMPEEKRQREQKYSEAMYLQGAFDSPMIALRYVQGDTSIKPKLNLSRLVEELKLVNELAMIIPPGEVKRVAEAVSNGASLADVLPPEIKPFALQQLEMQREQNKAMLEQQKAQTAEQKEQTAIMRTRAEIDLEQMKAQALRAQAELEKAENADVKDQLTFLVDAERAGLDVPDGTREQILQKLAERMGARVEQVPYSWYEFYDQITGGGKEFRMVPIAGAVDEFAGEPQAGTPGAGPDFGAAYTETLGTLNKFIGADTSKGGDTIPAEAPPQSEGMFSKAGKKVVGAAKKAYATLKREAAGTWVVTLQDGTKHEFPTRLAAERFSQSKGLRKELSPSPRSGALK